MAARYVKGALGPIRELSSRKDFMNKIIVLPINILNLRIISWFTTGSWERLDSGQEATVN